MKLRFTRRATENLVAIAEYLNVRNPAAGRRVRTAIYASLQHLLTFPRAGRMQRAAGIRKLVTKKYAYLVYYLVDESADEIVILNVKHPAQEREHLDR